MSPAITAVLLLNACFAPTACKEVVVFQKLLSMVGFASTPPANPEIFVEPEAITLPDEYALVMTVPAEYALPTNPATFVEPEVVTLIPPVA